MKRIALVVPEMVGCDHSALRALYGAIQHIERTGHDWEGPLGIDGYAVSILENAYLAVECEIV